MYVTLGLSSDPTRMNVQWQTPTTGGVLGAGTSTVQWGTSPRSLTSSSAGYNWTFTDSSTGRAYSLHAASMTGLAPGATYFYRVGDALDGWSAVNNFRATRTDFSEAAPQVVAVIGDMGWTNAQALAYLETEVAQGNLDYVLHVGDYAYDLNSNNGVTGDEYQASIEPITAFTPYMGNPCVPLPSSAPSTRTLTLAPTTLARPDAAVITRVRSTLTTTPIGSAPLWATAATAASRPRD